MILDSKTLLIAHVVISLFCLVIALSTWRLGRSVGRKGPGFWAAGFALMALGIMGLGLRGMVPDLVSVGLANVFLYGGMTCHFLGVQAFLGKRPWKLAGLAMVLAFGIVHILLYFAAPSVQPRFLLFSLFFMAMNGACAYMLWRRSSVAGSRCKGAAIGYAAAAVLYLFRFSTVLLGNEKNWLSGGLLESLYFLGSIVVFAGTAYVELQLVNGIVLDEREASIRAKAVLLRDMNHRTKNNLMLAESLVYLESSQVEDPLALGVLDGVRGRLHSISTLHDHLSRVDRGDESIRLDEYLETLVQSLRDFGKDVIWKTELQAAEVSLSMALPVGLVVNELATNSLKYAARDRTDCLIRIFLEALPEGLAITVADNGPGMPPDHTGGVGSIILETLADQLGASLEYRSEGGLSVTLRLPPQSGLMA